MSVRLKNRWNVSYSWYENNQCSFIDTWPVTWTERRLVVRSVQQATTAEEGLRTRITHAQQAVAELTIRRRGKQPLRDLAALEHAAAAIVALYRVGDPLPPRNRPRRARSDQQRLGDR